MSVDDDAPCPAWVRRSSLPVWITTAEGTLCHVNERARAVLGLEGVAWLGTPCHLCVGGTDADGRAVCGSDCRVRREARQGDPALPIRMRVARGRRSWLEVVTIPWQPAGCAERLIHCAREVDHEQRIVGYLQRIARRSGQPRRDALTLRQREILQRLACGDDLPAIAAALFVSRVTVRNHVQRILGKLGVHSVLEAIAVFLLDGEEGQRRGE